MKLFRVWNPFGAFLVQNGADSRALDHEGRDPLYYAKVSDASEAALCAHLLETSQSCRDSFIT